MGLRETSIGGANRAFPSTIWSDLDPEYLLRTYWKPVYAYIRTSWRKPVEEAKDLTQAFFTLFLQKEYLAHLSPERGSFRGYLKTALRHFLQNADRAAAVRSVLSIDASPEMLERVRPISPEESPEQAFDRTWVRCLLDRGFERLQRDLTTSGKDAYFEAFRAYCLEGDPDRVTYGTIAERLGCRESDVRYRLAYCRGVLRGILAEQIREVAGAETDVERELREILSE